MQFQLHDIVFSDTAPLATAHSNDDLLGDDFEAKLLDAKNEAPPPTWALTATCFGRTAEDESVCVHVRGFKPELYYDVPRDGAAHLSALRHRLAAKFRVRQPASLDLTLVERFPADQLELDDDGHRLGRPYARVGFPSLRAYRAACYDEDDDELRPHHTKPSLESKFFKAFSPELVPSGWVRIVGGAHRASSLRASFCVHELWTDDLRALAAVPDRDDVAPLRCLAFDIEAVSDAGGFPKAEHDADVVCTVSVVCWRLGEQEKEESHAITLRGCAPIDGCQVHACTSEARLLATLRRLLIESDADFVLHYNGFGFDWPYLWQRSLPGAAGSRKGAGCAGFAYLSKLRFHECALREKKLSSSGLGANTLHYVPMPGRANVDVFLWYKARYNKPSYKLDDVACDVTGERKLDFAYDRIKPCFDGTDGDRAEMAEYCVQDSAILRALTDKLQLFVADVEQSRVCRVLVERLTTHAQGFKVVSQLNAFCDRVPGVDGAFVLSDYRRNRRSRREDDHEADDEAAASTTYQGATVIEPQCGYHGTTPVIVVDFASLYPSAMISDNLCISTLVRRPEDVAKPGVVGHAIAAEVTHHFTTRAPGILPSMLTELLATRKRTKRRMEQVEAELDDATLAPDERAKRAALVGVLNKRQLALKISANSIYGFMGATASGPYPCQEAAATTTAIGRRMLEESAERARGFATTLTKESDPTQLVGGFDLIYGDTDSLFFTLSNITTPSDAFAAGEAIADDATRGYAAKGQPAKKLEMEKLLFPCLLFSKKKYSAVLWNRHRDGTVVSRGAYHSGTANKRRDSCPYVQKTYDAIIEPLLFGAAADARRARAMDAFHAHFQAVVEGRVQLDDWVITKAVRDGYKDPEALAHLNVIAKQRARAPGSETRVGDRVAMVYVRSSDSKAKARDLAEDVAYVRAHGLPIALAYYLEHQLHHPVLSLLSLIHPQPKALLDAYLAEARKRELGQSSIERFVPSATPVSLDARMRAVERHARQKEDSHTKPPTKKAKVAAPTGGIGKWLGGGKK